MVLRRWALHIVLALTLVIGQQGAALHELSHLLPEAPAKEHKHAPNGGACEKCVAYAKFASALPAAGVAPSAQTLDLPPAEVPTQSPVSRLLLSYPARGPPALL
jgi:hypothetical protein